MVESGVGLPGFFYDLGLWVGLVLTLALFSIVFADNAFARLAKHVLVGAGMGYAALMAFQYVIRLRLLEPLAHGQWLTHVAPLALSILLALAGLERILWQGRQAGPSGAGRKFVQMVGVVPLAILIGVGLGAGLIGVFQGTLVAQSAWLVGSAFAQRQGQSAIWIGVLTLLLTTATLLSLTVDRGPLAQGVPRPLRPVMSAWVWIGERALWLAVGVILGRIFAARFTLLVDRALFVGTTLRATGLWQWVEYLWSSLLA